MKNEKGQDEYFTLEEAKSLIGKRFSATTGFASVLPGTVGEVIGTNDREWESGGEGWTVAVKWHLPDCTVITESLSKRDMEMVIQTGPSAGRRAMEPVE